MDVEVRQANIKDREDIGALLEEGFPNSYRYPERWEWLNLHNPFISDAFGIPEWIAVLDGRIIGHTGAMIVPVKMSDGRVMAGWSIDTLVSSAARGLGIGKKLQAANQAAHPLFMSLEMTAVNRAIKKKLGAREGPVVSLLYRTDHILPLPVSQEISNAVKSRFGLNGRFISRAVRQAGLLKACCWILKKRIQKKQGRPKALPEASPRSLSPRNYFPIPDYPI